MTIGEISHRFDQCQKRSWEVYSIPEWPVFINEAEKLAGMIKKETGLRIDQIRDYDQKPASSAIIQEINRLEALLDNKAAAAAAT